MTSGRSSPLIARFALVVLVVGATLAPAASAARKGRAAARETLDVVVLPFSALGGKKAPKEAAEAVELELELIDNTRVQSSDTVVADLAAAGDDAFEPATLGRILARRGVEVLVATPPGLARAAVVAFATDGRPRVVKELPRGADTEQLAATTMAALKPALARWSATKPVRLPGDGDAGRGRGGGVRGGADVGADVDDDDILAESDRTPKTKPGGAKNTKKPSTKTPVDDEEDPSPRGRSRNRSVSDDDAPAPRVLEESPTSARRALDTSDDDTLAEHGRRTLADVEDEAAAGPGPVKPTHMIGLSGSFDGATWHYAFAGDNGVQPDPVTANFYPGGSVRFDVWPLEWLGVDANASLASVQFQIKSGQNLSITPSKFVSWQVDAGAGARARALFRLNDDGVVRVVGLGGRLGYRYWSGSVEAQIVNGTQQKLTIVPGYLLHGVAIGPEVYLPLFLGDHRLELELKVDALPLTFYSEQPDNPGGASLAFGYRAELLARYDLFGGFFVEVAGKSTGATINFDGAGDRVTIDSGNQLVPLAGGRALNVAGGFSVGVGFLY